MISDVADFTVLMSRGRTIVQFFLATLSPIKSDAVQKHKSSLRRRPFQTCLFLQALFCSSLPHPAADKDYALYEVGTGCEVAELIPGIDLLSEAFRSNGRSVVAALRWITEELARARYLITVSTLARHISYVVSLCYLANLMNPLVGCSSLKCPK